MIQDQSEVHQVADHVRQKYLLDRDEICQKLKSVQIPLQDLISTVLMIEKLEDNILDNGLDLRHRLFSENAQAIALVERFLRDKTATIDSLK